MPTVCTTSSRPEALALAAAAALCLPLWLPAAVAAQEQSYFYLDRSAIFYSFGNETVFEAQIAPQLVVHETVSELFTGTTARGWRRGWSLSASPMVRLRMAATRSKPITPASFMPHGVGQLSWLRNTSDASDELGRPEAALRDVAVVRARRLRLPPGRGW